MPKMLVTPAMCDAMRDVLAESTLSVSERDLLEKYGTTAKSFSMEVIDLLREKLPTKPFLHELLAGSNIDPPTPPPDRKKDPQLVARLDKIRTYLEDREYDEMVKDIRQREIEASHMGEMRAFSSQMGEGVNILVAKGTAFAVGFFASKAAYGDDPVYNTIAGLIGLIIGFFIESTLYVVRSSEVISHTECDSTIAARLRGGARTDSNAQVRFKLD